MMMMIYDEPDIDLVLKQWQIKKKKALLQANMSLYYVPYRLQPTMCFAIATHLPPK